MKIIDEMVVLFFEAVSDSKGYEISIWKISNFSHALSISHQCDYLFD
jgi:hypothetical protein